MKKFLFLASVFLSLTLVVTAQHVPSKGLYTQIGTSINTDKGGTLSQELEFGYYAKSLRTTHNIGVIGETNEIGSERTWLVGAKYGANLPVSYSTDILVGAEAKVDVTDKFDNYVVLEPQVGVGFNISQRVAFQTGFALQFFDRDNFRAAYPEVNFGLNVKLSN